MLAVCAIRGDDTASPAACIPGASSPSAHVDMVQLPCSYMEGLSPILTTISSVTLLTMQSAKVDAPCLQAVVLLNVDVSFKSRILKKFRL